MKTTDEWMAETMQPILDRIAGDQPPAKAKPDALALLHPSLGLAFTTVFTPAYEAAMIADANTLQGNKAEDRLPDGCDGCREEVGGRLICCVNQTDED